MCFYNINVYDKLILLWVDNKHIPIKVTYISNNQARFFIDKKTNDLCLWTKKKYQDEMIKTLVLSRIKYFLSHISREEKKVSIDINQTRFRIFDKTYNLRQATLKSQKKYEIIFNNIYLNARYQKEDIVRDVYVDIVKQYVTKRVKYWQIKMGLLKNKITLKFSWMRWCYGHCASKGINKYTITFSNYLLSCDYKIVDDTIVHELAHMVHMNHKKEFWDLVRKYIRYSLIY